MSINLACAALVIKNEIEQGMRMKDITKTYALAIKSELEGASLCNWTVINNAIAERWGRRGLVRVKNAANRQLFGEVK